MSETERRAGEGKQSSQNSALSFRAPAEQGPGRGLWISVAAALVLVLAVGALLLRGDRAPSPQVPGATVNRMLPMDAYAAKLSLTELSMSQSSSLSGGTSTFIDGKVRNTGDKTIIGVTVQVSFANDEGLSPQIETVPMTLIRTREPYVDTQPISAAPLKPGDQREFRLIFENIPANWNQQLPELRIVKTTPLNQ